MHNSREQHIATGKTKEFSKKLANKVSESKSKKPFCVPALMTVLQDWQCQAATRVSAIPSVQSMQVLDKVVQDATDKADLMVN